MASFQIKSLETIDFNGNFERIQSPRSKKVLFQMGLDENKLFFISIQDYLNNHPEIKVASSEIQAKRYNNYEKRRLDRISTARENRNQIIKVEESNSTEIKKTQSHYNIANIFALKEQERLDQMKKHQISEMKTIIDYELQMSIMRKKNEAKIKEYQELEELAREQKQYDQIEKIARQRLEEKERENKLKKDNLDHYNKVKKLAEEEQQKKEEENQRKELLEKESQRRQLEQLQHQNEIQKNIDMIMKKRETEQYQKQKENEQKEGNIKRMFEERERENCIKTGRMQKIAFEKKHRTNIRDEEESQRRRSTFERKQIFQHKKMQKYAEELDRRSQEHNDKVREKERKIIEFTFKNQILSQKRIEDYDNRSEFIQRLRKQNIEKTKQEFAEKVYKKRLLERDNSERKMKLDASINLKHTMLLEKYYQSDEKIKYQKDQVTRAVMDKLIDHKIQLKEANENMIQNNKKCDYKKKLKMDEITEMNKRIEDIQKQKNEISEKSRHRQDEMKKRKEEMLSKIHKLLNTDLDYTQEQLYKKVFTPEEYEVLSIQTPSQYRSTAVSPSRSRYGFSPKINSNKEDNEKNTNKQYSCSPKKQQDKSKLFQYPRNEDDLFVTQGHFNSLGKMLGN